LTFALIRPTIPAMDRRRFLVTSLAGAIAAPRAAEAQPQAQVARIGVIPSGSPATSAPSVDAFRQRLQRAAWEAVKGV